MNLLRIFRRPNLKAQEQAALEAHEDALTRRDTRKQHETCKAARKATLAALAQELGYRMEGQG